MDKQIEEVEQIKEIKKNIKIKKIEKSKKVIIKKVEEVVEKKKYKEFQVDYLRVFEETLNSKGDVIANKPFPMESLLIKYNITPVKERRIEYKDEVIRLQDVIKLNSLSGNLTSCKNLWDLNFVRIKTKSLSAIATEDGGYDETLLNKTLGKNQYLAESTACLYDSDKQLFVIARNRDAVLPSGILEFLKRTSQHKNLTFAIIQNEENVKSQSSYIYRSLIIGIKDAKNIKKKDSIFLQNKIPSVFNAIKSFEGYGYYNIKIELSMGAAPKKVSMNNTLVKDTSLQLMESAIPNISKLEISSKADEGTSVETIDLLNNKVKDNFKIGFTRTDPLLKKDVTKSLLDSYNSKKVLIDSKII